MIGVRVIGTFFDLPVSDFTDRKMSALPNVQMSA